MPDLFHSPRLTFIRAKHHVADFNRIEAEFVNSNPWSHFVDKQSQPGQDLYKIQFTEPLPIMLPCIVFDAVNNLRALLDQAGYAAAVASGKISPKKTNFPFSEEARQGSRWLSRQSTNGKGPCSLCGDSTA